MKRILLFAILLIMAFNSAFTQEKANIKTALNKLEQNDIEPSPFFRKKTEFYRAMQIGRKQLDGTLAQKNIYSIFLYKSDNYSGVPHHNFIDFNNSEKITGNNGENWDPELFKANKILKSINPKYIFVPFYIGVAGICYEDVLVSCDKTSGDVKDALFVCQMGYDGDKNRPGFDLCTRQWSIDEKGEVTVYELKLLTTEKTYFKDAPVVLRMQRIDTTYQIDENGKFQVIFKKEYHPKDYRKEELYREGKQIWEGNEIPIRLWDKQKSLLIVL